MIGKTGTVARFGGDEFLIMINTVENHSITQVADKVMRVFDKAFTVDGEAFSITASAGVATYPVDGEDSDDLIKNADLAMYKAKSKGKNQYALCTKEMKDELKLNIELSYDLTFAVERNELTVYYQPQIDLVTKK